jgi:serine/threonine-protein kinase RIO1
LLATDGPVIIDLPQPVDAAGNNHAPRMLIRDVNKLRNFFGQYAPDLLSTRYGAEIWALHASGVLVPGMPLTGRYEPQSGAVDLSGVLREIASIRASSETERWPVQAARTHTQLQAQSSIGGRGGGRSSGEGRTGDGWLLRQLSARTCALSAILASISANLDSERRQSRRVIPAQVQFVLAPSQSVAP